MVWKQVKPVCALVCALVIVAMATIPCAAASLYQGTISSTYVEYAKNILAKCPPFEDYVFFRSGQYVYTLVCGDLELSGDTFTGTGNLDQYVITYYSGNSGYSGTSYYTVSGSAISTFSLDTGSELVYSSLGSYPSLIERGDFVETLTLLLLVIIALCLLIRPIYSFVLRRRDCS